MNTKSALNGTWLYLHQQQQQQQHQQQQQQQQHQQHHAQRCRSAVTVNAFLPNSKASMKSLSAKMSQLCAILCSTRQSCKRTPALPLLLPAALLLLLTELHSNTHRLPAR
jgi:translation initiation factor 1 (eIF-1/SUI1)